MWGESVHGLLVGTQIGKIRRKERVYFYIFRFNEPFGPPIVHPTLCSHELL